MHEAGHAVAAIACEVLPASVEIIEGPPVHGRNRIPLVTDPQNRLLISAAGLAVELALFRAGRLVDDAGDQISQSTFIQQALGNNAAGDKVSYFGSCREQPDGTWPTEDDEVFLATSAQVESILLMDRVEALAGELLEKRILDSETIVAFWNALIDANDTAACAPSVPPSS